MATAKEQLKELFPFLQRATEMEKVDKKVAYYCAPLPTEQPVLPRTARRTCDHASTSYVQIETCVCRLLAAREEETKLFPVVYAASRRRDATNKPTETQTGAACIGCLCFPEQRSGSCSTRDRLAVAPHRKTNTPLPAFTGRMYALEQGLSIQNRCQETTEFLVSIMAQLEVRQQQHLSPAR